MGVRDLHRDWLTPAEVSSMFGLHAKQIERACRRGDIPAERGARRRWMIPLGSLLEALHPAVTPATRAELRNATVKGQPRKRRPVIRSSRARAANTRKAEPEPVQPER